MHRVDALPGQLLKFGFGELKTLALHMLVRRVGQQLMQSDDVAWNLVGEERYTAKRPMLALRNQKNEHEGTRWRLLLCLAACGIKRVCRGP